jgi:hypothetical protein
MPCSALGKLPFPRNGHRGSRTQLHVNRIRCKLDLTHLARHHLNDSRQHRSNSDLLLTEIAMYQRQTGLRRDQRTGKAEQPFARSSSCTIVYVPRSNRDASDWAWRSRSPSPPHPTKPRTAPNPRTSRPKNGFNGLRRTIDHPERLWVGGARSPPAHLRLFPKTVSDRVRSSSQRLGGSNPGFSALA